MIDDQLSPPDAQWLLEVLTRPPVDGGLIHALTRAAAEQPGTTAATVALNLAGDIAAGWTLAGALSPLLPPTIVAVMRVGEQTGRVREAATAAAQLPASPYGIADAVQVLSLLLDLGAPVLPALEATAAGSDPMTAAAIRAAATSTAAGQSLTAGLRAANVVLEVVGGPPRFDAELIDTVADGERHGLLASNLQAYLSQRPAA